MARGEEYSVRRSRGNIILTALFIAIFLFFLSVALIWTNRQDIALSLSMEHKLKAQSAARTAAYEAFYRLREFGELQGFSQGALASGADYEVELVSLEALGKRGEVLLIRARGKSGPVTSYLTLHLRDTRIAGVENKSDSRVLFFPSAPSEESEEEASAPAKALYGEFKLEDGGAGLVPGVKANVGPVFASEATTIEPPSFRDFVPVFDGAILSAWGPTEVVAPPFPTVPDGQPTSLRVLEYGGSDFDWKEIDPPTDLGDPRPEGATDAFEMSGPDNTAWTTSTVLGIKENAMNFVWTAAKPPTRYASDIEGSVISGEPTAVGTLVDWNGSAQNQQKFESRGAIFPVGNTVYSHGWHFVYNPHDGQIPPEVTFVDGSTLTRWPCVLKYTVDGSWEVAWAGLKEDGSVHSEHRPDPNVLAVTSDGTIYTVTETEGNEQRRLLTLDTKSTRIGDTVPSGQIIIYENEPYLVSGDSTQPALINLVSAGSDIDFQSLPAFLPEINGEVVDVTGTDMLILGMEGGYQGEPLDGTQKLAYTARPRYDFTYLISANGQIAVDGKDLWAIISIVIDESEPTFEKGYVDPPYQEGARTTLARYDGDRWHILPNGLRTCLKNPGLSAPGAGVVAALYSGLPTQVSRYSIISVDTNPF
jgi:hypothetical protein